MIVLAGAGVGGRGRLDAARWASVRTHTHTHTHTHTQTQTHTHIVAYSEILILQNAECTHSTITFMYIRTYDIVLHTYFRMNMSHVVWSRGASVLELRAVRRLQRRERQRVL